MVFRIDSYNQVRLSHFPLCARIQNQLSSQAPHTEEYLLVLYLSGLCFFYITPAYPKQYA